MAEGEGVQFLLELEAKLGDALAFVKTLEKTEAAALKADEALKKTEKQTGLLGKAFGAARNAAGGFAKATLSHFAALASFEGLKAVAGTLAHIGREALQAAGESERMTRSLNLLLGAEAGDDLQDWLDQLAKHTEFTDGTLKQFSVDLIKAGFSGKGLERALAATADMAALSTNKIMGASSAIALLSKVNLKGGISEKELVGFGIKPDAFFKSLAKDLGVGVKTVEKRLQEGKIKSEVVIEALYAAIAEKTSKPLGGAGVSMSTSFEARLEKWKDLPGRVFGEMEKNQGFLTFSNALAKITEMLDPLDEKGAVGRKALDALGGTFAFLGKMIEGVDMEKLGGRIENALKLFEGAVWLGATLVGEIGNVFDGLVKLGEGIGQFAYDAIEALVNFKDRVFTVATDAGAALWQGLKNGITSGVGAVTGAIEGLADGVISKFKNVLGIHSPSAVFADFGFQTSAGFSLGIEDAIPDVRGVMADAFAPMELMQAAIPQVPQIPPIPDMLNLPSIEVPSIEGMVGALGPISPSVTVGGGGGGASIQIDSVTINVGTGAGGEAGAREAAEGARSGMMLALQAALEQIAAQGAV